MTHDHTTKKPELGKPALSVNEQKVDQSKAKPEDSKQQTETSRR